MNTRSGMMPIRLSTLGYAILLLFSIIVTFPRVSQAAGALDKVTLQLKWKHQFQFAGYYAAIEKGFYRDAGLDVTIREADPKKDPVETVLKGEAEFGIGACDLLQYRQQGKPVVILGVIFQHSPLALIVRKDSGIKNLHELAGHRVMLEWHDAELQAYLQRERVKIESLTVESHTFDTGRILDGQIDAMSGYVTDELYRLQQAKMEYRLFEPLSAGIDFYGDNLFTTETQIRDYPGRVKAFREASMKGWSYAMKNPDEIARLIYGKYSSRHTFDHLMFEANQMERLMNTRLIEPGYMNPGRWRAIADIYAELGMLPPNMPLDDFLYEPSRKTDLTWIYLMLGISFLGAIVVAGVALYILRLNRRLRESETHYRLLAHNAIDIIWTVDAAGKLTYVSPSIERVRGFTPEEVMQHSILWAMPPEWAKVAQEDFDYYLTHGDLKRNHLEVEQYCKDGSTIWADVRLTVLRGADGKNKGVLGITRDSTRRKEAERALMAAKEKAEDATRLKDKFVSLVAHDLKSPLISITGYLYLMITDTKNPLVNVQKEMAEYALTSTKNLADMIDELLNISQLQTGKISLQPIFIDAPLTVQNVCESISSLAQSKKIRLANDIPAGTRIYADENLFVRVIQNLVSNAIKFCRPGDSIVIFRPDASMGTLAVKDTGIGIKEERIKDLFRHDVKTSTTGTAGEQGTGFGLPLCHDILQAHGGTLTVESEVGRGSTFYIGLPPAKPKILLVDDDPNMLELMEYGFRKTGADLQIVRASNGVQALEQLDGALPSLIIADISMPEMDGMALLETVRKMYRTRNIPYVVITSDTDLKTRDKAMGLGANDFIIKPFKVNEYFPRIRQWLS